MTEKTAVNADSPTRPFVQAEEGEPAGTSRYLPFMLLLFVGSGCAALVYEIVWFQMLSLEVGSSAISLGVILGTFMGGMCLGALWLPKFLPVREHPLRVYAKLELGIGILALFVLFVLPLAGSLYSAIGGPGITGLFIRGLICAIVLLPPTLLMGATLPAIARWVKATPAGMSWLGFFYGGNIVGAVFGSLLAGFYLLRVFDVMTATFVAMAINLAVAFAGFALSSVTPYDPPDDAEIESREAAKIPPGAWPIYVAIGLSGMTALASEVVWTRLLSLLLGATTYTFSLILGAFLTGLGIGSSVGAMLARSVSNPRAAFGWCQLLLIGGLAWAAYALTTDLPKWPVNPGYALEPRSLFQIDFVRCLWAALPAALLWGASFPLALAAVPSRDEDASRVVGRMYAANTVGAIVGAMMASLYMIEHLGTQRTQQILIGFATLSALIVLAPGLVRETGRLTLAGARTGVWALIAVGVGAYFISTVNPVSPYLVAYGRYVVTYVSTNLAGNVIFHGEGMNSSMAVTELSNGVRNYHNAGKIQASSEPQDMRLQRMLGHLTHLIPDNADSILVIGFGAGVTAGAVSIGPKVKHVTIAEIEHLVPTVVSEFFGDHNYQVAKNPKVEIVIDDARHFLRTTDRKFNAITSDPFDPWVKGAATLYTKEFFQTAKDKLHDGGIITVFVQLYESSPAAVKSEVATFMEVFPNGLVFGNTWNGSGYDVVLVGQKNDNAQIDIDKMIAKWNSPEFSQVAQSMREIGMSNAIDLFGTFAAQGFMLKNTWLNDAEINRDKNLRLQYLAGLGLNNYLQASIYSDMLQFRQYPDKLFTGSPENLAALRAAITGMPGGIPPR